ncbi:MAG: 30S ribosomal protein S2 [Acidobacteria bacterium]|nr:30S ribosomal protein S2 [Acidobacteriota bacterium]MYJ04941.1 30S ribosomal protein S2 [Acidobacteriota bacterium]
MTPLTMQELLDAGVHFGHQTRRWNPKMKPYIFGQRNGIYLIDLSRTAELMQRAEQFVMQLAASGGGILFVGTKRQAQDLIVEEAQRCGMYFVNERWLGGLLTNFTTIQRSLDRLKELEAMETDARYENLSKKEVARLQKEKRKLHRNLDGIRAMHKLPEAVFVVDTRREKIAVDEARKLSIPVIGLVDTNCDPDDVDYVIPGNDDALRSIRLCVMRIADAVLAGRGLRSKQEPAGGVDASAVSEATPTAEVTPSAAAV